MSYFKNMIRSGEGYRAWLVEINVHGEAAVHRLDCEGRPVEFAAGPAAETILDALRSSLSDRYVVRVPMYPESSRRTYNPYDFDFDASFERWSDMVACLNGKSSTRKAVARAIFYLYHRLGIPINRYICCSNDAGEFVVGPLGIAADEETAAKAQEEPAS
jgi:hypothetical protein